jgi:hypothetical protein
MDAAAPTGMNGSALRNRRFSHGCCRYPDCVDSVENALKGVGHAYARGTQILTSRDKNATNLMKALACSNIPQGFSKWQLPYVITGELQPLLQGTPTSRT